MTDEPAMIASSANTSGDQTSVNTGAAPTSIPAAAPEPWVQGRYPSDYPITWLQGRTAEEAATLFNQIYNDSMTAQPQQQQQAPQQPQVQQPQPVTPQMPTDDDFLTAPGQATKQYVQGMYDQTLSPQLAQMQAQNASIARTMVMNEERDLFNRFAPEIDQLIAKMDVSTRTPENIRHIVNMVKGQHYKELAKNEFDNYVQSAAGKGTMMPDGTVTPVATSTSDPDGVDFNMDNLPPNYKELLSRHRVTSTVLKEFLLHTECKPKGISLKVAFDAWVAKATKGDMVIAGEVL